MDSIRRPIGKLHFGDIFQVFFCRKLIVALVFLYSPVVLGHLLGVSQKVTTRVAHLFCINERVLLMGTWSHGFFSMTPVGATNVGRIAIDFEVTSNK